MRTPPLRARPLSFALRPQLWQGGALRPLIHTAFATLLMYHDQRIIANEMREVTVKMETLLKRESILMWGALR